MSAAHPAVHIERLVCGRAGAVVVPALDLVLRGGEALVVTGDNGSGKSTLLRTLAGLLPPLGGRARLEGIVDSDGAAVTQVEHAAHYLGHRNAMRPADEVEANLAFWQSYFDDGDATGPRVSPEAALEAFGLPGVLSLPFGHLSAGQQRRAALSRLLVVHRPVWILDEPTAALDAASTRRFEAVLSEHLARGGIAIAATHLPLDLRGTVRALHLEPPPESDTDAFAEPDGWG